MNKTNQSAEHSDAEDTQNHTEHEELALSGMGNHSEYSYLSPAVLSTTDMRNTISLIAREIEDRYKEGVFAYIDAVANYTEEIEKLKHKILLQTQLNSEDEAALQKFQNEIFFEERTLERLNEQFAQKAISMEEFKTQYSTFMEEGARRQILSTKEKEILALNDEIEEFEMKLLAQELERLNLLETLEPKRQVLLGLEEALEALEWKKKHFESTQLQQIHALPSVKEVSAEEGNEEDIVDTKAY